MLELLFLLGFSLHNLEEGLWLPRWSHHAGRFHHPVQADEFRFALIVVTTLGYLITLIYIPGTGGVAASVHSILGERIVSYTYHGFVGMMVLNVVFPHLAGTIALRRYAPGLLTGLLLNLPIGVTLIRQGLEAGLEWPRLLVATGIVAGCTVGLISLSFRAGRRIFRDS